MRRHPPIGAWLGSMYALLLIGQALPGTALAAGDLVRVSVSSSGGQGDLASTEDMISADGRYVAFSSDASNLVPGDTNGFSDVFVHDVLTGETTRVSVSSDGEQSNNYSGGPSISANGRFVSFTSPASNLVLDDTNGAYDVFVHDLVNGVTTRASVSSDGGQGEGEGGSVDNSISADGRYVAFMSGANNLVPGDTNGEPDIFVHDTVTGTTTRESVGDGGEQSNGETDEPSISADGRYVAFSSNSYSLVPGEDSFDWDIFLRDRVAGTVSRISDSPRGGEANGESFDPAISSGGRFVAFESFASNLVAGDTNLAEDVFLYEDGTGSIDRDSVSSRGDQGNDWSYSPAVSAHGRFIAFGSSASNLVRGDTNECPYGPFGHCPDVFVRDRVTGRTFRASVRGPGVQGDGASTGPALTPDARYLVFESEASNFVPGDTNGANDVFWLRVGEI